MLLYLKKITLMKSIKNLSVLLLLVLFSSCYKYDDGGLSSNNNTGSGSGGSGGGATSSVNCKACNYFPTCPGSRFLIADTVGTTINANRKDTITFIKDTTIDNKVFQKLSYSLGSNSYSYQNCTNGVSSTFVPDNANGAAGPTNSKFTRILLKANEPIGATWTDSAMMNGQKNMYISTILDKGISLTVNGNTYTNVIEVEVEVGVDIPLVGFIPGTYQYFYFAKDIGIIYTYILDLTGTSKLQSYGLKSYYIP
jgi:hypothetical protein